MILAGLFIIVFYIGLYKRYSTRFSDKKLTMILIIGLINAISIILTGIFSETVNYELHIIFSIPIFITFIPILYLVGTFFITNSIFTKSISYYGFVVAIFTFMLLIAYLVFFFCFLILNGIHRFFTCIPRVNLCFFTSFIKIN